MGTAGETKREESLFFIMTLAMIGGFINAYSFLTRGEFTSMHTRNMCSLGMGIAEGSLETVIEVLIPISGCLMGSFVAQICKTVKPSIEVETWQRRSIFVELLALLLIGMLPMSIPNKVVNWFLSFITTFQLSNFRKCEGDVLNTTICTGNLRTLGQFCADMVVKHDRASVRKVVRYACLVFSFPAGIAIGAIFTNHFDHFAIWVSSAILFGLWLSLLSTKKRIKMLGAVHTLFK